MRRRGLVAFALLVLAAAAGPARGDEAPTPAESLAALRLADPGLAIELVASEPAISAPVAVAWDEHGRMYVVEMTDYPVAPDGGRVKRLEDRDGDGVYEHVTVFADKLHWPSGVLPWNGGVLVTAAPDLIFFKDGDGDGRAEVREVVLTGFGEGNQQLRVNSPTWGMDHHVYLANGRSGGNVRRPGDPPARAVAIPRNDLRVAPGTGAFERVAGFSQFGLARDDWGDRFPSWNTVPLRHVVLETSGSADGRTVAEVLDLADGGRVYSLAPSQKRFNAETVAYFNASCGPTIHRGDLLGDAYRGHAFVCEPLTSVVHHRRLDPDGPTFVARRVESEKQVEFLASSHPWFRPVNLANGPDGALYVVDFCRAWVEHPAFVPEAQRSSVDFREGFEHGRIWRIAPRGKHPKPCLPGTLDTAGLVATLEHPNGWCRDTAQRLIVERQDRRAVAPLKALAARSASPLARVHALWTLWGLDALDAATLVDRLRDDHPRVRESAARLALRSGLADAQADALAKLAADDDPRVRLRAAEALGKSRTDDALEALATIAARDAESAWTSSAVLNALASEPRRFLGILAARQPAWLAEPTASRAGFLARLGSLIGRTADGPDLMDATQTATSAPGPAAAFALLEGLAAGRAETGKGALSDAIPEPSRAEVRRIVAQAFIMARDPRRPVWVRERAIGLLVAVGDPALAAMIPELLEPEEDAAVQRAAARALARAGDPALADSLLGRWETLTLATRRILLGVLSDAPALAGRLLDAVSKGSVPVSELDPGTREALRRLRDPKLRERAEAVLGAAPGTDRRDLIQKYENALSMPADVERGRALFARHCQTCHARGGQGAKVGPELASVAGRPPADLLTAILDPSREVAPDGIGVVVATTTGRTLTGLLVEESPAGVRLRRAEGVDETVPRGEIEALRSTGRSLMPDGLEQVLAPRDLADLIAFLRSP